MKVKELEKFLLISGQSCKKCKSSDVKVLNRMHPNMSTWSSETRKCNNCGYEWHRMVYGR